MATTFEVTKKELNSFLKICDEIENGDSTHNRERRSVMLSGKCILYLTTINTIRRIK